MYINNEQKGTSYLTAYPCVLYEEGITYMNCDKTRIKHYATGDHEIVKKFLCSV